MSAKHRIDRVIPSQAPDDGPPAPAPAPPPGDAPADGDLDARLAQFEEPPGWAPRADRRAFRSKFAAALRGLKHAFRGDSSFFAHAYRGLLIAFAAALLGVGPLQWCMLALAAALVLIAECAHSAVATLARCLGEADAPGPAAAREIAAAGVFVAVLAFAATSITVLALRFAELLAGL